MTIGTVGGAEDVRVDPVLAPPPPPSTRTAGPRPRAYGALADWAVFGIVVAALGVGGALLRIWMLGHDAMNSDEAVVGLVAQGILHGHQTAFVWHQDFGGVEPYVVAVVFALFGTSAFALNLTPALLAAGVAVLTWRLGARLFGNWVGIAAAALAWVWPESGVFNSTREYGYHEVALLLGMVVLLETVRIVQHRPARGDRVLRWGLADWAVLGLAAGVGWWASAEIAYFVLPALVVLVACCVRPPWLTNALGVGVAALTTALGALPWIVAGINDRWATIRSVRPSRHSGTYDFRLGIAFSHALPFGFGIQTEGQGLWEGGPATGHVLYGVALGVIGVALAVVALRSPAARLLVVYCLAFPFLYAAFPTAWFWQDGRYGVFLTPVLALVLMGAVGALEGPVRRTRPVPAPASEDPDLPPPARAPAPTSAPVPMPVPVPVPVPGPVPAPGPESVPASEPGPVPVAVPAPAPARTASLARRVAAHALAVGLCALGVVTTCVALNTTFKVFTAGHRTAPWTTDLSPSVTALAHRLEEHGVHGAYADYWVAYDLQFLSGGAVTTFPVAQDKNPVEGRAVTRQRRAAWIFVRGTAASQSAADAQLGAGGDLEPPGITEIPLVEWLREHHIAYRVTVVGPFSAVTPARNVTPVAVNAPGTELG